MKTSLIVGVIGPDRPGLVEQLSRVVTDAGGNWEGSRLMQLGGQFAGMVQVVIAETDLAQFETSLSGLESEGLEVSVLHAGEDALASSEEASLLALEVVGQDRSGIVAAISRALAEAGINVVELATDCREAPWSGERLFHTTAKLDAPDGIDLDALRDRIEAIAGDLMVEIALDSSAPPATAASE